MHGISHISNCLNLLPALLLGPRAVVSRHAKTAATQTNNLRSCRPTLKYPTFESTVNDWELRFLSLYRSSVASWIWLWQHLSPAWKWPKASPAWGAWWFRGTTRSTSVGSLVMRPLKTHRHTHTHAYLHFLKNCRKVQSFQSSNVDPQCLPGLSQPDILPTWLLWGPQREHGVARLTLMPQLGRVISWTVMKSAGSLGQGCKIKIMNSPLWPVKIWKNSRGIIVFDGWSCLHFQKSSSRPARHVSIRSVPTFGCSAQLVESRLHGLMPQIDEHWRDTNDFYQPSKPLQNRLGAPVDICSISWSLGITPRIGLSQNVQEKLCWNGRMVTKHVFPRVFHEINASHPAVWTVTQATGWLGARTWLTC